jgi:predicted nucleic acid-binding protein
MIRVVLDTNVMLDSVLQRSPWHLDADQILREAALGRVTCAFPAHVLATVFYVARKGVGLSKAHAAVRQALVAHTILRVDKQTLVDADALPGKDFEDNINIAAAVTASVDAIVTRNVPDFAHSPIPVWDPPELLKRLAASPSPPPAGGTATSP